MNHTKVLKRAWDIIWSYRALWVFGIILALTTGGGGGGNGSQYRLGRGGFPGGRFALPEIPAEMVSVLLVVGVGLACLILILIVIAAVARWVAETALIRMVDDYEGTGEKRGVRQGFRMGWSRTAWRLFLIDLVITVPVVIAFILLFVLAGVPLLALRATAARAVGTVVTIGLGLLVVLLLIVVVVILSVLMHFFRRACALEKLGVMDSIRHGYGIVRRHVKDVAIMWLILLGLGIGWFMVMIPVVILLVLLAGVVGGLPALLVGWLASLMFEEAVPWILGAAVGIPIFILALAVPLALLSGLWKVFKSSVWTLTYRELRALEDTGAT